MKNDFVTFMKSYGAAAIVCLILLIPFVFLIGIALAEIWDALT